MSFFILKGDMTMEKQPITKDENKKDNITVKVPILNIRLMTDEEWSRLAYKNMLKRNGVA